MSSHPPQLAGRSSQVRRQTIHGRMAPHQLTLRADGKPDDEPLADVAGPGQHSCAASVGNHHHALGQRDARGWRGSRMPRQCRRRVSAPALGHRRRRLSGQHLPPNHRRHVGPDLSERPRPRADAQARPRRRDAWLSRRTSLPARLHGTLGQRRLANRRCDASDRQSPRRQRAGAALATTAQPPLDRLARRARTGAPHRRRSRCLDRAADHRRTQSISTGRTYAASPLHRFGSGAPCWQAGWLQPHRYS